MDRLERPAPPRAAPLTAQRKLLETIVVIAEMQVRRERVLDLFEAAQDARDSSRALSAESTLIRRRARQLRREAAALVAESQTSGGPRRWRVPSDR